MRTRGGPLPYCAALTVPLANRRSIYRFLCGPPHGTVGRLIDRSKFRQFKGFSLDVIFHGCDKPQAVGKISMLLRDNVYENLRSDILTCRLAPGDDMREQDLAERYAVSRQPVREALLRLEREHLVTVQPRQGYRVNPISLSDARDLLRFRLALEPACVGEAIENAPENVLTA